MLLINCKVELSLKWYERFLLTAATTATFRITDAKLYVPIVTLSIEDNSKLTKLLNEGFKRLTYWNEYKVIPNKTVEFAAVNDVKHIRELLDANWQGVKRLFALAYNNTAGNDQVSVDSYKKYFLPRVKIDNYVLILMVETLMINQLMIQLNNMMKFEKYLQDKVMITQLVVY